MKKETAIPATMTASMFEYSLGQGFSKDCGPNDKNAIYNHRFIQPFIDAGYVEPDDPTIKRPWRIVHDFHQYYWPTEAGFRWWFEQRVAEAKSREPNCSESWCSTAASGVLQYFEGKGIGSEVTLCPQYAAGVWASLRDGLLDYVDHKDYYPCRGHFEERLTVRLTAKGMAFFDALPKLELICA
jgi:hypothetical protein